MIATIERSETLSLEKFLSLPETQPASEYAHGIIIQKSMPKGKHSRLQTRLARAIDQARNDAAVETLLASSN